MDPLLRSLLVSFGVAVAVITVSYVRSRRAKDRTERNAAAVVGADGGDRSTAPQPRVSVREIVRPDGKERVRVFRRPEGTYGVVFDSWSDDGQCWLASFSPGTGAVYA